MFVLLEHAVGESVHWDFLIEMSHSLDLATWRLARDPSRVTCDPIDAERIADHRRLYLNYEGPISGDRGTVRRVDRGESCVVSSSPERWRFSLRGACLSGDFEIIGGRTARWTACSTSVPD